MRTLVSLALTAALIACGSTTAPLGGAPPPGKSYREYLRSDLPKRPADTNEDDKMVLHVIDIGQGTALLFEFPCGAMLVDTGGEKNEEFDSVPVLVSYLERFFARRPDLQRTLDSLVVTHPHLDHTRGIAAILETFRVRNVITNGQVIDDEGGQNQTRLEQWVESVNTDTTGRIVGFEKVAAEDLPDVGRTNSVIDPVGSCDASPVDPVITALWGRVTSIPDFPANPNDHSVVLRIQFGDSSVMMTGDLELEGLHYLSEKYKAHPELLDVDVYVVGHHASKNATAPHEMRAMSPKIAVVSCGPYERDHDWTARRFGHPHMQAVGELTSSDYGVLWPREAKTVWVGVRGAWEERPSMFKQEVVNRAVYATGWDGTIDVRLYRNGWLEVETEREQEAP